MQHFRKTTCLLIKCGEDEKQEEEGQHYSCNGKLVTSLEVQMTPCTALPLLHTSSHPLCAQSRLHHWIPSGSESGAACRSRWAAPQSALETQAEEKASLREQESLATSSNLTPDFRLRTLLCSSSEVVSDFPCLGSTTETLTCQGYDYENCIYGQISGLRPTKGYAAIVNVEYFSENGKILPFYNNQKFPLLIVLKRITKKLSSKYRFYE